MDNNTNAARTWTRKDDEDEMMTIALGDCLYFKADVETCGTLVAVSGPWLTIETTNDEGDTRRHKVLSTRCNLDG